MKEAFISEVFNLVNLKGGVGKTVSTINIAYAMNKEQKRVLIIDTDSQGNILTALGQNPNDCPKTLADLILTAMERPISSDEVKGADDTWITKYIPRFLKRKRKIPL